MSAEKQLTGWGKTELKLVIGLLFVQALAGLWSNHSESYLEQLIALLLVGTVWAIITGLALKNGKYHMPFFALIPVLSTITPLFPGKGWLFSILVCMAIISACLSIWLMIIIGNKRLKNNKEKI